MIISRITGGLANQIYEFMTAVSLSEKYNVELILDISETLSQFRGFLLDCLNIPNYRKIYYDYRKSNVGDLYIHEDILSEYTLCIHPIYVRANHIDKVEKGKLIICEKISGVEECIKRGENVYIYGSFDKVPIYREPRYFNKLLKILTPKNPPEIYERFIQMTHNQNPVAIHIRRGDYLLVDRVTVPTADYYKAGIEWFRNKLDNPQFYVFTDDTEWAGSELGYASDIHYISGIGGMDVDVIEMFILSSCKYKILSYHSGYSALADMLNTNKGCITIRNYNDNRTDLSLSQRAVIDCKQLVKRFLAGFSRNRKGLSHSPFIPVAKRDKLAKNYEKSDAKLTILKEKSRELLNYPEDRLDEKYLDMLDDFGLDYMPLSAEDRKKLLRKKMFALVNTGNFTSAFLILHKIRFDFDDEVFLKTVEDIYREFNKPLDIHRSCSCNYIIMPGEYFADPSVRLHALTLIGTLYRDINQKVSFIFKNHPVYDQFIEMYTELTDADKTCYDCKQYSHESLMKDQTPVSQLFDEQLQNICIYEDEDSKELLIDSLKKEGILTDRVKFVRFNLSKLDDGKIEYITDKLGFENMYKVPKSYYEYIREN